MRYNFEVRNYRSFAREHALQFSVSTGGATAFVGPNNAGKSAPLRFMYEFRGLFSMLTGTAQVVALVRGGEAALALNDVTDWTAVFHDQNDGDLTIRVRIDDFPGAIPGSLPVVDAAVIRVHRSRQAITADFCAAGNAIELEAEVDVSLVGNTFGQGDLNSFDYGAMSTAMAAMASSLYLGSARNAINVTAERPYYDIAVGQAFVSQWREYKSGPSKAHNRAAIDVRDEIARIFGFRDLEINPSNDDRTLQVNIGRQSYLLHELGSGVAQVIIGLTSAATRGVKFILIDEPELSLHPPLQLEFLATLRRYAGEAVLFSTHSVGLARAMGDPLYIVRRPAGRASEIQPYEAESRLVEFLGEMGFSAYRELGFRSLLLVEGPTDVMCVRHFLRKLNKDHEVMLLSLGGSDLINGRSQDRISELSRLGCNVAALIDSEKSGADASLSVDRKGFLDVCAEAGVRCHALAMRATENYLSDRAVKQVKGDDYRALEPYELLKALPRPWPKTENWRIAEAMTMEELRSTDLGVFLAAL